jgi:DNA-binding transcriptional LysR family regulator
MLRMVMSFQLKTSGDGMDCGFLMHSEKDIIVHIIGNLKLKIMKHLSTRMPGLIAAVQAAESGSFSSAAKVLDLTPAAVSKNVASLESQLGVRLFNRTTRQLSLTEEGRAFVAQAREGLESLESASTRATQNTRPSGLVRVSCAVGFGRRYVLPLLPAFYGQQPDVQVELSLNDQAVDLVREGFDVGIRGGAQPPEGMVARKICNIPAVLVATPKYLKSRGVPKHYTDLAAHDLLRVRFTNGRMSPWLFKDKDRVVTFEGGNTKLLISDPEVIQDAALLHLGIARMGRHHAQEALARGQLVDILPRQHVAGDAQMAMFYPHRAGLAPRVRVWVDFMLAQFVQLPTLGLR